MDTTIPMYKSARICGVRMMERNHTYYEVRKLCNVCNCVLYVRSAKDHAPNDHDLDDVFQCQVCMGDYYCVKDGEGYKCCGVEMRNIKNLTK